MKKSRPPVKRQGHTQAEQLKHLYRKVEELEGQIEELTRVHTMTAADLRTALDALAATVAALPAPAPALITQPELDQAVTDVQAADAALKAKTPPTP